MRAVSGCLKLIRELIVDIINEGEKVLTSSSKTELD